MFGYHKQEIWKEYPLNISFEGNTRIEVSNMGNLKTYNLLHPNGNVVKGSMQGGYRIFRTKLKSKWSDSDLKKIEDLNTEISKLNVEIKTAVKEKQPQENITELRSVRDNIIQKRKKLNHKITKKYTINLAILFHKAVAEVFLDAPNSPDEKFVIHKDFDKLNNAVVNLQWASQNELDARLKKHPKIILREFNKQFMGHKPNVPSSKLNELEVLRIKMRLKRGDSLRRLAKQFQVSDMQIHRIKTGENWSHVKLIEDIKKNKK